MTPYTPEPITEACVLDVIADAARVAPVYVEPDTESVDEAEERLRRAC